MSTWFRYCPLDSCLIRWFSSSWWWRGKILSIMSHSLGFQAWMLSQNVGMQLLSITSSACWLGNTHTSADLGFDMKSRWYVRMASHVLCIAKHSRHTPSCIPPLMTIHRACVLFIWTMTLSLTFVGANASVANTLGILDWSCRVITATSWLCCCEYGTDLPFKVVNAVRSATHGDFFQLDCCVSGQSHA